MKSAITERRTLPCCPICGRQADVAHVAIYDWACRSCRHAFAGRLFQEGDPIIKGDEFRRLMSDADFRASVVALRGGPARIADLARRCEPLVPLEGKR